MRNVYVSTNSDISKVGLGKRTTGQPKRMRCGKERKKDVDKRQFSFPKKLSSTQVPRDVSYKKPSRGVSVRGSGACDPSSSIYVEHVKLSAPGGERDPLTPVSPIRTQTKSNGSHLGPINSERREGGNEVWHLPSSISSGMTSSRALRASNCMAEVESEEPARLPSVFRGKLVVCLCFWRGGTGEHTPLPCSIL